ncbi:hypothetical protein LPJ64_001634 [Coemansia asiatica]|uniref:Carboxypeptidase n=1 Tax=Coemansia asiatica TaxID=1052880 RepID=A0A9W8CLV2_9FUNG|nr:hypothetical protein LPJ64_001634 [Coemansia asiatica]
MGFTYLWSALLLFISTFGLLARPSNARLRVSTHIGGSRRAYSPTYSPYNFRLLTTDASPKPCTSEVIKSPALRNPPPMRLKQPQLCDPQVRQYSGYVDMEDKHVFFWYFGSRQRLEPNFNATKTVPLVFWFSGGPGCSSQIANWQENGPCMYMPTDDNYDKSMEDSERKKLPHEVKRNPWAWNTVADIVYIDQPVGTGFSYGSMPNSTEAAADTAWRTMQAIYAKLSKDARDRGEATIGHVTLMGESYAGRYIPLFTEYLMQMNKHIRESEDLQSRGFVEMPLKGIAIGNGLFDYRIQSPTYYTMGCKSTYPPLFSSHQCSYLKNTVNPTCEQKMKQCYESQNETIGSRDSSSLGMRDDKCVSLQPESWRTTKECAAADRYCGGALNWTTMISTYDVRPDARLVPDDYVEYLRTKEFTDAVGIDNIQYEECSDAVFDQFGSTNDEVSRSAMASVEYILDHDVPVLLYSGDADLICNWYGNLEVARALQWKGRGKFEQASAEKWSWPAKSGNRIGAGQVTSADNLHFLRIYEAGHEVPYYQPQASLYMLAQFLTKQKITSD